LSVVFVINNSNTNGVIYKLMFWFYLNGKSVEVKIQSII